MRIVGGKNKGRRLLVPPKGTRPTSEKVREALFSKLEHEIGFEGMRVLDLFAGSGAFAFEALSRGAHEATMVDVSQKAVEIIRRNKDTLGQNNVQIIKSSAEIFLNKHNQQFDLIFIDPPYAMDEEDINKLLEIINTSDFLAPNGEVIIERDNRAQQPDFPQSWVYDGMKDYGGTLIFFAYRPREDDMTTEPEHDVSAIS